MHAIGNRVNQGMTVQPCISGVTSQRMIGYENNKFNLSFLEEKIFLTNLGNSKNDNSFRKVHFMSYGRL